MDSLKQQLISVAQQLNFPLLGFCSPQVDDFIKEAYKKWLERKQHAGMQWMERNKEIRENPGLLLPGVQTVIVVALPYVRNGLNQHHTQNNNHMQNDNLHSKLSNNHAGELHNLSEKQNNPNLNNPPGSWGTIAKYAQSRDYHYVFKSKMKKFMQGAQEIFQGAGITDAQIIASCDTKPILERYFAWKAGLGFIGKNSLLITKEFGSYVLLGCFLTTVKLECDEPGEGTCAQCTRCLDACPTKAIVSPRTIDGSKCLAYWTIEHRGEFPEQAPPLAGRLFGCDICQDVCPYNKVALRRGELPVEENKSEQEWPPSQLQPNQLLQIRVPIEIAPEEILSLSAEEFRQRYQGTPLMRAGYEGMRRNARKVGGGDNK